MASNEVFLNSEFIQLDQFLKWVGLAETGGQAKLLITGGEVRVNQEIEHRRTRKLYPGDLVMVSDLPEYRIGDKSGAEEL